jgi:hypothetical protein
VSARAGFSPSRTQGVGNTWASFRVGFDGPDNGTVEQIGTTVDTTGQQVFYGAWAERFPAPSQTIKMTVHPGDVMTATASRDGPHRFTLTLIDETTAASFATTQTARKAAGSSAEIIAEAPSDKGWGLATFDSVRFKRCSCNDRPVGGFGPDKLDLVDKGRPQATTSRLSSGVTSFRVTPLVTVPLTAIRGPLPPSD